MSAVTIVDAIEVFVQGFSFTRSFTYPYCANRITDRVWVVRDAERARGDYRTEEYVGCAVEPAELDAIARQHTRGRYCICAVVAAGESDAALRSGFKSLGYRLMATEPFMAHSLQRIRTVDAPVPVARITTPDEAAALAKVAGSRQILDEHLCAEPAPMRQYAATADGRPIGWVGSVAAAGAAWCSNMFVAPEYRRRGIATALMTRMLEDDRAAGAKANVLLASQVGSKLYSSVGYEQIGTLFVYTPKKRKNEG